PAEPHHFLHEKSTLFILKPLICIHDEGDVRKRTVDGFQAADVLIHVDSDFHLEQAETPKIPAACQYNRAIKLSDGNRDVGFALSNVRAAPQLPQRHAT